MARGVAAIPAARRLSAIPRIANFVAAAREVAGAVAQRRVGPEALGLDGAQLFKKLGATVDEISVPMHLVAPAIWLPIAAEGAPALRRSKASAAKTVMQSCERQAGSRPDVLQRPLLGLKPFKPLNAAGTRPEPAVSVPSASGTRPAPTATADPALDPPLT